MKNSNRLIFIFIFILTLTSCKSFSPQYSIEKHPLIDKIWSVDEQRFISAEQLKNLTNDYEVILLGETHDNARHHQLQAMMIDYQVQQQRSPSIAFEMLDKNQQDVIEQFQQTHQQNNNKTDQFARAIAWQESGWPEWSYYRPVFVQAIENNLPIIAANLDLTFIRSVIRQGEKALSDDMQDLVKKYQYDKPVKHALEQDILAAHCDMLPEKMLAPMLLGQQVRDLSITQAILSALKERAAHGVILIAGSGHTRKDFGVPFYLQKEAPEYNVISIAFMEVQEGEFQADSYAKGWALKENSPLPFDYVWFTPQAQREDPCEKMKAHMKKKKEKSSDKK